MTMTQATDAHQATLDRVREGLADGTYFALQAASQRSRYGYKPVLTREAYAHCIATLGQMAGKSDAIAQLAVAAIKRVNLYGTDSEEAAHVYEAVAAAWSDGFDDVVGCSGPEGGRYGKKPFSLRTAVIMAHWLKEATRKMDISAGVHGVGWAVTDLTAELNVYGHELPNWGK